MSRILKRPMFRRGGMINDGVMSLASSRKNYEEGTDPYAKIMEMDPELGATIKKYGTIFESLGAQDTARQKQDILSNLLIRGGLGLVSGEGAGKGTLGGIATAFQKPTEEALGQLAAMKARPEQARMAGAKMGLEAELQKSLQELKGKQMFAAQLPEEQIKADASIISKQVENRSLPPVYRDPTGIAKNLYKYEKIFGEQFIRIPEWSVTKDGTYYINPESLRVGQITYYPGRGLIEKVQDSADPNEAFRPYAPKE
jgi:hypothetical protein